MKRLERFRTVRNKILIKDHTVCKTEEVRTSLFSIQTGGQMPPSSQLPPPSEEVFDPMLSSN